MIEDPGAPGGYRIGGTLWLPIQLGAPAPNEKEAAGQDAPDRRLRKLVAGEGFEPPTSGL